MGEIFIRPFPTDPLPFTGQRLTSAACGETQIEHFHRYLYARELCRGRAVLDVASGEGYGSALLAQVAASVVGIEIAEDAVAHARRSYQLDNLSFVHGDARKVDIPPQSVDVVVSFETIEHFAEQDQFLTEVRRVLRPDGLFVVSTPDRDNYSPAELPANPYHVLELTQQEFHALLTRHFGHVRYLMQRPVVGSVMLPSASDSPTAPALCFEKRGEQHFEASTGLARPRYMVALASDRAIGPLSPTVFVETSRLDSLTPSDSTQNGAFEALRREIASEKARTPGLMQQLQQQAARLVEHELRQSTLRAELDRRNEYQTELAAKMGEAIRERGELAAQLAESELRQSTFRADLDRSKAQIMELAAKLDECEVRESRLEADLDRSKQQLSAIPMYLEKIRRLEDDNKALHASTSWRITAPLRAFKRAARFVARRSVPLREPHSPPQLRIPEPEPPIPPVSSSEGRQILPAPACPKNGALYTRLQPISVVMPTFNRADLLHDTLRCCSALSKNVEIEFVVIDDGSTDRTPETLSHLAENLPNLTWRRVPNGGPAQARNLGASIAKHPVILFMGDDIQPIDDQFFSVHARLHAINTSERLAVLGKVVWPEAGAIDVSFVMSHIQGRGGEQFGYAHLNPHTYLDWRFFYTSNISVKKSVVADWTENGFQPRFKFAAFEDAEFAYRLQMQPGSFQIYYDPTSVGRHLHPYTVDSFISRQMGAGMMAKTFLDLHPEAAEILGVGSVLRSLHSPSGPTQETLTADYLSVVEGIKSWARIVENVNVLGHEWWHESLLSAVFELSYLQGFLLARAESSSDFASGYDQILKRCMQHLRKTIHHELTGDSFLQGRLGLGEGTG